MVRLGTAMHHTQKHSDDTLYAVLAPHYFTRPFPSSPLPGPNLSRTCVSCAEGALQ